MSGTSTVDHTLLSSHWFFEDRSDSGCASGRSMVTSWHCRMPWTVWEAWVRLGCGMSQWMGPWDGVGVGGATERLHQGQWLAQWERNGTCWGVAEGWVLGFPRREKCPLIFLDAQQEMRIYENLTIQLNGKTYIPRMTLIIFFIPFISHLFLFSCDFLEDFALQDLRFQELQELEREKQERRCPSLKWASSAAAAVFL